MNDPWIEFLLKQQKAKQDMLEMLKNNKEPVTFESHTADDHSNLNNAANNL